MPYGSEMIPYAARAMAARSAQNAMRGGVRKPRYNLPSWLNYNNVLFGTAAAKKAYKGAKKFARKARKFTAPVRRELRKDMRKLTGRKRQRGALAKPPSTPSARVTARYAVAPTMTKFKKAKTTQVKVPKSVISHYREYGQFNGEKVMYINHEHMGSIPKFWYGISLGLAKMILAKGRIYPGKSLEDPMMGPRSNPAIPTATIDNSTSGNPSKITLLFLREDGDGVHTRETSDISIEDISVNPDVYLSLDDIARLISVVLRAKYEQTQTTWLSEATLVDNPQDASAGNGVYLQNLDDAEICLYVNSLLKLQNITPADHGVGATGANAYDRSAIDANPLTGRVYTARNHHPIIDGELSGVGNGTLDKFFGNVNETTGITLLGFANDHHADDIGRVSHVPPPPQIYGNQAVKSGTIHMAAGAMKFHKTSYTLKKTFKNLCEIGFTPNLNRGTKSRVGSHTMFGFCPTHKHGDDTINIGFNRETDVGCYIKYKRIVHPLKTNYTNDIGVQETTVTPTNHVDYARS